MGIFLILVSLGWSFIENMRSPEDLQLHPANYQRTLDSMVNTDGCSGVFISNQGHFLTALHCFQGAYPTSMENAPPYMVEGRWEYLFKKQPVFGPGRRVNPGTIPFVVINGKPTQAQIVFSGARLGVNYLDTAAEDFVIVKIPTETKNTCSPIAVGRRPQSGQLIWAYGYPSAFVIRRGVEIGDSQQLKISNGRVSTTVAQGIGKSIDLVRSEEEIKMQEFLSDTMEYRKNVYLASVDVDEGMSGGPVFNKHGEVLGLTAMAVPSVFPGDKRRLSMQSIVGVLQSMRSMMTAEQISEVFDCE